MADDHDLPEGWEEAARVRRLMREAPTSAEEEPIDDASVIHSTLHHKIEEQPNPLGGQTARIVAEERGIRKSNRRSGNASDEQWLKDLFAEWGPDDTRAALFMAANRHLRAKGELDFFKVASIADDLVADNVPEEERLRMTSHHFAAFVDDIETRTGSLSIESAAAKFIRAHDQLFMLLSANPEVQAAANEYADAWHWLHLEWSGEHELAAQGMSAEKGLRGLQAGPQAARRQAARRRDIIEVEYGKYAANEPNDARRHSSKTAANVILPAVNAACERFGVKTITESTLERALRELTKQ